MNRIMGAGIAVVAALAVGLKEGTLPALPLDGNPFADWSVHLLVLSVTRSVLLSVSSSLRRIATTGVNLVPQRRRIERWVLT